MAIAVEMIVCSGCRGLITECFICRTTIEDGDEIDCLLGGGFHNHVGCEE